MEAVGEEDEEDQEVLGEETRKTYDAGVRQRELANQKARIVSQMTGRDRAGTDRSSPRRSATTTPTGGLHPAKRVAAASDAGGRVHPAPPRVSLFDATRHNLDKGLEMGETFTTPRGSWFSSATMRAQLKCRYRRDTRCAGCIRRFVARLLHQVRHGFRHERRDYMRALQ